MITFALFNRKLIAVMKSLHPVGLFALISLSVFSSCSEKEKEIIVESIAISQPSAELEIGETLNLKATVSPSNATYDGITWTSTKTTVAIVSDFGLVSALAEGNTTITAMAGGKTASCSITVVKGYVAVSSISLNKDSFELIEGDSETLTATVSPSDATDKTVSWSSSKESVATVKDGIITAVKEGEATITAKAGERTASCKVLVIKMQSPDAIDLGLSVKWASFNLGATKPEEYGNYYAWGETEPKNEYSWATYKWCMGSWDKLTKYCSSTTYGHKDDKTVLDPEDDAAHVTFGDKWRMPTITEMNELACCTLKEVSVNGVEGLKIIGKNGNSIFLPAAGGYDGMTPPSMGVSGIYWASSKDANSVEVAHAFGFTMGMDTDYPYCAVAYRSSGWSIRSVYGDTIPVQSVSLDKSQLDLAVGQTYTLTATVKPSNATNKSVTWTSNNTSVATVSSSGVVTAKAAGNATITVKTNDGGKTATCSVNVSGATATVAVTGVSLNTASLTMTEGNIRTLTATVTPSDATNKTVTWSSSNTSVASVSSSGVVTAKSAGSVVITVTTNDGGKRATCSVTVKASTSEDHAYVDMGNGLKWATMNVGANSEREYGSYFGWGETVPYYTRVNYKWQGSGYTLTKYNTDSAYGIVDNKTVLEAEDDAATVNWGSAWRTPTDDEWAWLLENCTWNPGSWNGRDGFFVRSKIDGYTNNKLFLPFAGFQQSDHYFNTGISGFYWSSSLYTDHPNKARVVSFSVYPNSNHHAEYGNSFHDRWDGLPVRPVSGSSN